MRRFGAPQSHATHPNVTPLIDVVMCLIIFFMLMAKIGVSTGADLQINLPAAVLGRELTDPSNALTLNVRAGGIGDQPMVTAAVEGTSGEPQELRMVDPTTGRRPLLEVLKKLREGDPNHSIPENPNFKVIIRGERDMQYRYLQPVLEACMDAKIKSVNYATQKAVE